jgi:hypothetical protein
VLGDFLFFILVKGVISLGSKALFEKMEFFFSHSSNGIFLEKACDRQQGLKIL